MNSTKKEEPSLKERFSYNTYNQLWIRGMTWASYLDYARSQNDCVVTEDGEVHYLVTGAIMKESLFVEHCKELDRICDYHFENLKYE